MFTKYGTNASASFDCPRPKEGMMLPVAVFQECLEKKRAGTTYADLQTWLQQDHQIIVSIEWLRHRMKNSLHG